MGNARVWRAKLKAETKKLKKDLISSRSHKDRDSEAADNGQYGDSVCESGNLLGMSRI